MKLFTISGQLVFSITDYIENFQNCIPVPSNLSAGVYFATITLHNDCMEVSETYRLVNIGKKSSELTTDDYPNLKMQYLENTEPVDSSNELKVEMYPNPSKGLFNLDVISNRSYSLEITDNMGNLVYRIENLNQVSVTINNADLTPGLYFVKLNNGVRTITKKMIVL